MKKLIYLILGISLLLAVDHIIFPHHQVSNSQLPVLGLIILVLLTVLSRLRLYARLHSIPQEKNDSE